MYIPAYRVVVDYRRLKAFTIADRYPIPSLRLLSQDIGRGHSVACFSKCRLTNNQGKNSILYTTRSLPIQTYAFRLWNFPIPFSRLMAAVMAGLIGNAVFSYLDDLLIVSKDVEEYEI